MFRAIKISLGTGPTLLQTALAFNRACQLVLNYGFCNRTFNKNVLNRATYGKVRQQIPDLPSALVQTARDEASEMLKRTRFASVTKRCLSVRYDKRTFKFFPDSNYVSLATTSGRLHLPLKHYTYMDRLKGEYTSAQLTIKGNKAFLYVQVKMPDVPPTPVKEPKVLGIDRGIVNVAVCSDNTFFNSKHLRAVKGRYQYLRRKLQHLGTRSAKRKLKRLSGRERRFVLDINHRISKAIVNKPYDVFAMEKLLYIRNQNRGKRFNKRLGDWSFAQLQRFIQYKVEQLHKSVVFINPCHTSQTCSRCGYTTRTNRKGLIFHCERCGFTLHADLNASRNIGALGKSKYLRLSVNQPIVAPDDAIATAMVDDSYKPTLSDMGS